MPSTPRLNDGVRLHWDRTRELDMLLYPEGMMTLNESAKAVLELVDGVRDLDAISEVLSERYGGAPVRNDVDGLLKALAQRGLVLYGDADAA
jgi:pyrroloquinoline quinone biosynthesis protein D